MPDSVVTLTLTTRSTLVPRGSTHVAVTKMVLLSGSVVEPLAHVSESGLIDRQGSVVEKVTTTVSSGGRMTALFAGVARSASMTIVIGMRLALPMKRRFVVCTSEMTNRMTATALP